MNKCKVKGCNRPAHAARYCARHYCQVRKYGMVQLDNLLEIRNKERVWSKTEIKNKLKAMNVHLKQVKVLYDNVVGVDNRIKWRREITSVQQEITRLLEMTK